MCKICDEPETPIAKGGGVLKRYDGATIARGGVLKRNRQRRVCVQNI